MNIKDYQMKIPNLNRKHTSMATEDIQTPLTYEAWKGDLAPSFDDKMITSMQRLHGIDYKKEFEEMLQREYQEYLSNFNGNWLL